MLGLTVLHQWSTTVRLWATSCLLLCHHSVPSTELLFRNAVENVRGHNEYAVWDYTCVSLIAHFITREWLPTVTWSQVSAGICSFSVVWLWAASRSFPCVVTLCSWAVVSCWLQQPLTGPLEASWRCNTSRKNAGTQSGHIRNLTQFLQYGEIKSIIW